MHHIYICDDNSLDKFKHTEDAGAPAPRSIIEVIYVMIIVDK